MSNRSLLTAGINIFGDGEGAAANIFGDGEGAAVSITTDINTSTQARSSNTDDLRGANNVSHSPSHSLSHTVSHSRRSSRGSVENINIDQLDNLAIYDERDRVIQDLKEVTDISIFPPRSI